MSRYAQMFERLNVADEIALGGFLMLGHPGPDQTAALLDALVEGGADMVEVGIPFSDPVADGPVIAKAAKQALKAGVRTAALLDALVEGGADMVEVGIPFSDPVADGPVIAKAAKQALEAGVRTADCLAMIAAFRARHPEIPVGILTYANIVVARGRELFCAELAEAGADSLLVADVPSIEAAPWAEAAVAAEIDPVLIAAPTTPAPALETIARLGRGYTYCVARLGVTGTAAAPALDHSQLFDNLAKFGAPPPVLGFGISSPDHVRAAIAAGAAGVFSGSAMVELAALPDGPARLRSFCSYMKSATRHCSA